MVSEKTIPLLKRLSEAHGAPSNEGAVREIFRREVARDVRCDGLGGVLHEVRGKADSPRLMLTAHMDEVGFIVQSITKEGFIRFMPLGGWWGPVAVGQRVRILTQSKHEVPGVIASTPPHFMVSKDAKTSIEIDDMTMDVGARNAEDVKTEFGIQLGDTIVPDTPFVQLKNNRCLGKAFDNRVGMALIIEAVQTLKQNGCSHPNVVCAVGTVQEELGMRGASTASTMAAPDVAIILEGPPSDENTNVRSEECQGVLGNGPQIRIMDTSALSSRELVKYVISVAETHRIPYQLTVRKGGATDAKYVHRHSMGVPTVVIGVPTRYIHSPNSILDLGDYDHTLRLIVALIQSMDASVVENQIKIH